MGERFVAANCREHLVCRAGWMMGGGPAKDKKFIQKLMAQVRNGARELFIVDDKLGTPTYTVDFARNTELLISTELWGLYNMVCPGVTSRLEVARHDPSFPRNELGSANEMVRRFQFRCSDRVRRAGEGLRRLCARGPVPARSRDYALHHIGRV